jgi:hypothetical protein
MLFMHGIYRRPLSLQSIAEDDVIVCEDTSQSLTSLIGDHHCANKCRPHDQRHVERMVRIERALDVAMFATTLTVAAM